MKIVVAIARILLGLIFVVFGLNGLHPFLPMPPPPPGLSGQYLNVMIASHYFLFVAAIQVIGGALLLINRYVTLGLVMLGPVIFNILLFHVLMNPGGIGPGVVAAILWLLLAYHARRNLAGIFSPTIES